MDTSVAFFTPNTYFSYAVLYDSTLYLIRGQKASDKNLRKNTHYLRSVSYDDVFVLIVIMHFSQRYLIKEK